MFNNLLNHTPNLLTVLRMALIPAVYAALLMETTFSYWLALGFYIFAGVTDFLDGWLARRFNMQSGFGRMLDPIADKLMVACVLVLLVDNGSIAEWHIIAALIILCREILVSGLREYLIELRVGLPVSRLAKIKTAAQMVALGFLLPGPAGEAVLASAHMIGLSLLWLAAILTLATGYDYARISIKHAAWHKTESESESESENETESKSKD